MTKNTITKVFESYESYEAWTEQFESCTEYQYIPVAIVDNETKKISCDLFTECKSWKTALRRFEKAFAEIDPELMVGWIDIMNCCAENGTFEGYFLEDINHFWTWGIDQIDENTWYVYISLRGIYAGYEVEPEETNEAVEELIARAEAEVAKAEEKEGAAMEKKYKEIRKISARSLRQLCIDNDWYTGGDEDEYGHLLFDLAQNKENLTTADIIAIAADIMAHSDIDADCTIENIAFEVARIANVFFKEI